MWQSQCHRKGDGDVVKPLKSHGVKGFIIPLLKAFCGGLAKL